MFTLSDEEEKRYARQLLISEIGISGQQKLKQAKVLIIGTGGLGSPLSLYLTAAGIGTVGILDNDVIDTSNLQRQILHDTQLLGHPKIQSAEQRLHKLNPHTKIIAYQTRLTEENVKEILTPYEYIIDATDNYTTRFILNDECVRQQKPLFYGAISGFTGQLSIFAPHIAGGCYRCLVPMAPSKPTSPTPVIGATPGIIGSWQAMEVLKWILHLGTPLCGVLQTHNFLTNEIHQIKLRKDPECPCCGAFH